MKHLVYILIVGIGLAACSNSLAEKESNSEVTTSNSQIINENRKDTQLGDIRADFPDFKNFKYPKFCLEGDTKSFVLKDGVYKNDDDDDHLIFAVAKYADVTGDGNDEALVIVDIITGGSAMPACVYIFTLENPNTKKVKLLWDFQTGDRANGGLRKIYGENGDLVIERYTTEEVFGACCPKYYIKETYKWNKGIFEKQTEEKFLKPEERN